MAIIDYASLKTELANYTHRNDLSTEFDTWIGIVESEMNLELRTRSQLTSTTLSATTRLVALPTDFLEVRNLEIALTPIITLKFVTSDQRDLYDRQASTGQPRIYTISGPNIVLAPPPDQTYTLNIEYYSKIPNLPANTTNWLITNFPHMYLYGCLAQAGAYIQDRDLLTGYISAYGNAKDRLNKADDDAVYNPSPRLRPDVGW